MRNRTLMCFIFGALILAGCERQRTTAVLDPERPQKPKTEYFDKKYLLQRLPDDYYKDKALNGTFKTDMPQYTLGCGVKLDFKPLGYDTKLNLQYTHVYSNKCDYRTNNFVWSYGEVCFPNTCLTNDKAYATVTITNPTKNEHTIKLWLFYQNTSYWYPTNGMLGGDSVNKTLQNYYGASNQLAVIVPPDTSFTVKIPYTIGANPKWEFNNEPYKDPARPGNYEFMLLASYDGNPSPWFNTKQIDLKHVNPFAQVMLSTVSNYETGMMYVGPHHFKFVFLDEYFDGANNLDPTREYFAKDGGEKRLCDTCTGWYRDVISEHWNADDFFKGYISKQPFVKADYGIRKENCKIDSNGIAFTIPKSVRGNYKKTWGELVFGPAFKYGHLTVRAKFSPMVGNMGTPNGIIHNLWLYQRDPDEVDSTNPYHLVNGNGVQLYEIDFEIWNSMENVNSMWDDKSFIYYSIVDYMRDTGVAIKPNEVKQFGKYRVDRLNKRQAGIAGEALDPAFFDSFHTYELYWYPDHVQFLVDGKVNAVITPDMAKIPDRHMYLWIGSPLYQDGTYYNQSSIPFLKEDKHTYIDYIKIE